MRAAWAIAVLCALAAAQERPLPDTAEMEAQIKRVLEVWSAVEENAAEPADAEELFYRGAIPGMLRQLDPHSVFFDKDQFQQLKEMQESVTRGFGSIVSVLPGRVFVLQTQPGSPAQKSGLAPGDEIISINGYPLSMLDMEQLVQLLGAARQKPAQLLVRRPGSARPLPFTLTPAELQTSSVDRAFLIEPGTAYIRVTSFDLKTAQELRDAIEKLGGAALEGLILDLRDNPGGVVNAGLETASLFLQPGQRILSARGRSAETQDVDVPPSAMPYGFRLAVLVNGRTASAAEIVAGAIQDHDRGAVAGEPTFGKGLVQRVYPLSGDTGLALTTAFYYTPSGRSIQRPLKDSGLAAVSSAAARPEYRTDGGRVVKGGGGIEPDEIVFQEPLSPLGRVLDGSGVFPAFAGEWLPRHKDEARRGMEITPAILDEFQLFLSQRNIRPTVAEWSRERERIRARLLQEILNQAVGVEAGDEIELRRDPVVRRALRLLAK
jgi:carboxyl-terminal processing protease